MNFDDLSEEQIKAGADMLKEEVNNLKEQVGADIKKTVSSEFMEYARGVIDAYTNILFGGSVQAKDFLKLLLKEINSATGAKDRKVMFAIERLEATLGEEQAEQRLKKMISDIGFRVINKMPSYANQETYMVFDKISNSVFDYKKVYLPGKEYKEELVINRSKNEEINVESYVVVDSGENTQLKEIKKNLTLLDLQIVEAAGSLWKESHEQGKKCVFTLGQLAKKLGIRYNLSEKKMGQLRLNILQLMARLAKVQVNGYYNDDFRSGTFNNVYENMLCGSLIEATEKEKGKYGNVVKYYVVLDKEPIYMRIARAMKQLESIPTELNTPPFKRASEKKRLVYTYLFRRIVSMNRAPAKRMRRTILTSTLVEVCGIKDFTKHFCRYETTIDESLKNLKDFGLIVKYLITKEKIEVELPRDEKDAKTEEMRQKAKIEAEERAKVQKKKR